jgi:hypothetical protein
VLSFEPNFVFPQTEMPAPVPLYRGVRNPGRTVTEAEFAHIASVPVEIVYGDNIPRQPVPELPADSRRAEMVTARQFVDALNRRGGKASLLHLPEAGLRGNSHFMYQDLNNVEVANQLSAFLTRYGLDAR